MEESKHRRQRDRICAAKGKSHQPFLSPCQINFFKMKSYFPIKQNLAKIF